MYRRREGQFVHDWVLLRDEKMVDVAPADPWLDDRIESVLPVLDRLARRLLAGQAKDLESRPIAPLPRAVRPQDQHALGEESLGETHAVQRESLRQPPWLATGIGCPDKEDCGCVFWELVSDLELMRSLGHMDGKLGRKQGATDQDGCDDHPHARFTMLQRRQCTHESPPSAQT